ncbi:MAG TPA: TonB-dependent receptor, partial [Caulobacteraceae bacterium]
GFEVGGDASNPLGGGVLKFVGLLRREQFQLREDFLSFGLNDALLGGVAQTADNLTGETVGRLVWSHGNIAGWSVETGGEVAFNTLDSDVDLFEVPPTGPRTPVALPVSDVLVEEIRGEAFVSGGRKLTPTLAFDAGLAVETSTLTVSGDAEAERTLTFFKPRSSLEWTPNADWRLRAAIERLVAQLDFNDFVSGAEFANGRVNSGNPDVEPERTWRFAGVLERRVLTEGKLRLSVYYDRVQMVQDRIPTDLGLDAPGNLGDGRRVWFEAIADLPLQAFRIPGGRLNMRWLLQDSDVEDPYTGRGRPFSGEQPWTFSANFRQDLKSLNTAWGVDYYAEGGLPQYRVNEIDVWNPDNDFFGAFVEHRPSARTTVKLDVRNLLDRDIVRERDFFFPDRRTLQASRYEERRRWQGRSVTVSVKRTFG